MKLHEIVNNVIDLPLIICNFLPFQWNIEVNSVKIINNYVHYIMIKTIAEQETKCI